jgi:DNA-directed RNA polymerase specialized sigma24 family protein
MRLYEALRDYRNRDQAAPLARRRAESRLFELLFRMATKSLAHQACLQPHEAEEVAALFIDSVFKSVGQCQALDYADPARAVAGTVTWVRKVYQSRLIDWRRQEKRHSRVVPVEGELSGVGDTEAERSGQHVAEQVTREEHQVLRQAVDKAREAVRQFVQTGQPEALLREARKHGVGRTLEMLNLQIQAFERVHFNKEPTYDVALALGQQDEGDRLKLQNRVSQWVGRGRHALLLGARLALEQTDETDVRQELERLTHSLAQPLKKKTKRRTS